VANTKQDGNRQGRTEAGHGKGNRFLHPPRVSKEGTLGSCRTARKANPVLLTSKETCVNPAPHAKVSSLQLLSTRKEPFQAYLVIGSSKSSPTALSFRSASESSVISSLNGSTGSHIGSCVINLAIPPNFEYVGSEAVAQRFLQLVLSSLLQAQG
jgi:hypothetical protein